MFLLYPMHSLKYLLIILQASNDDFSDNLFLDQSAFNTVGAPKGTRTILGVFTLDLL